MVIKPRNFRILGVHPVEPTDDLFEETLEMQWGPDLSGAELEEARRAVHEHFAGLYLFEVEIDPPGADLDWRQVAQPAESLPPSSWQVPYNEQVIDRAKGRWVFFMHFVDLRQPLRTPLGAVSLPPPSARPPHLAAIEYEAP
jgi:hypothetical protein